MHDYVHGWGRAIREERRVKYPKMWANIERAPAGSPRSPRPPSETPSDLFNVGGREIGNDLTKDWDRTNEGWGIDLVLRYIVRTCCVDSACVSMQGVTLHWKWRKTRQQPSRAQECHQISCCLVVSLLFLRDILAGEVILTCSCHQISCCLVVSLPFLRDILAG